MNIKLDATKKELDVAKNSSDGWEYLFYFTDKYFEAINNDADAMKEFNEYQHTLLAYNYLYGEVMNGGFIQLIQNGYGAYIFDNPFGDMIRQFGATEMADIIDKARVVFNENRTALETKTSLEEFVELYKEIKGFEPLESEFYKIDNDETLKVRDFVAQNIEKFASVAE